MHVQQYVSRALTAWMGIVTLTICILARFSTDEQKQFYRFGPNNTLKILGFAINTGGKYTAIVLYCFFNSIMRTLYGSILKPWLINNIQDESKTKPKYIRCFAYEVTSVTTVYVWFDWFIYMNILLAQLDMMLVEVVADLVMALATTWYYLSPMCCGSGVQYTPILMAEAELSSKV